MVFLHDLDLRMRCTLQTLYRILVLLLQYSSKNHKDAVTINDPGVAFAEVIKSNYNKFKNKKGLHKDHYQNYFFDDPSKGKAGLRKSIRIDSIDMGVICMILRTPYLTSINKCCQNCDHECTKCNSKHLTNHCDTETGNCNYAPCATCKSNECGYMKVILFAIVCRVFRNANAHITAKLCVEFEAGNELLEGFPDSDDWSKIWNVVNEVALSCLKFLQTESHIHKDAYKDHEMNLYIAYRHDYNFLVPIVGNYVEDYRKKIIGEAEITEHMQKFEKCLSEGNCLSLIHI